MRFWVPLAAAPEARRSSHPVGVTRPPIYWHDTQLDHPWPRLERDHAHSPLRRCDLRHRGRPEVRRADALGAGRFAKIGLPASDLLANLDGVLEIGCGLLILIGLFTKFATLPMIADMLGAILLTKIPLLWGNAVLYPKEAGIWDFLHEARLEVAMLCGCLFLLIVGAGSYSVDARVNRGTGAAREEVVAA
jgi:putative oxidoreductase